MNQFIYYQDQYFKSNNKNFISTLSHYTLIDYIFSLLQNNGFFINSSNLNFFKVITSSSSSGFIKLLSSGINNLLSSVASTPNLFLFFIYLIFFSTSSRELKISWSYSYIKMSSKMRTSNRKRNISKLSTPNHQPEITTLLKPARLSDFPSKPQNNNIFDNLETSSNEDIMNDTSDDTPNISDSSFNSGLDTTEPDLELSQMYPDHSETTNIHLNTSKINNIITEMEVDYSPADTNTNTHNMINEFTNITTGSTNSNINTSSNLNSFLAPQEPIPTGSTTTQDDIIPLNHFCIHEVPGDGSCLYHAVVDQLKSCYQINMNHLDLRNNSNLWLRSNANLEIPMGSATYDFITLQESTVDSIYYKDIEANLSNEDKWSVYIDKFSDPAIHAEDAQLYAVSETLSLRICIHSHIDIETTRVIQPVTHNYDKTVYIYRTPQGNHYDSLILKDKATPERIYSSSFIISTPPEPSSQVILPRLSNFKHTVGSLVKKMKTTHSNPKDDSVMDLVSNDNSPPAPYTTSNRKKIPKPPPPAVTNVSSSINFANISAFTSYNLSDDQDTLPLLPLTSYSDSDSVHIQSEITSNSIGDERLNQVLQNYSSLTTVIPDEHLDDVIDFHQQIADISEKPFYSRYITITGLPGLSALRTESSKTVLVNQLTHLISQLGKNDLPRHAQTDDYDSGIEVDWEESSRGGTFRKVKDTSTLTAILLLKHPVKVAHNSYPSKHIFSVFHKVQGYNTPPVKKGAKEKSNKTQTSDEQPKTPSPPTRQRQYTIQFIHPSVDINRLRTGTNIMVFRGTISGPDSFITNSLLSLTHSLQHPDVPQKDYAVLVDTVYHKRKDPTDPDNPKRYLTTPETIFSVILLHKEADVKRPGSIPFQKTNNMHRLVGFSPTVSIARWYAVGHRYETLISHKMATYSYQNLSVFVPHSDYLRGGSNVSYITLPDDDSITATQLLQDLLVLTNTSSLLYPRQEQPSGIQNIFIQTSDSFSSSSILRTSRACVLIWYSDRSEFFDPSGLSTIYAPYYPKDSSWSATLIETTPSGFDHFRRNNRDVLQEYYQSLPSPSTTSSLSGVSSNNISTSSPSTIVSPQRSYATAVTSTLPVSTPIISSTSQSVSLRSTNSTAIIPSHDPRVDELIPRILQILSVQEKLISDHETLKTKQENLQVTQETMQVTVSAVQGEVGELHTKVDHIDTSLHIKLTDISTQMSHQAIQANDKFDMILAAVQRQPQSFPHGHGASGGNG